MISRRSNYCNYSPQSSPEVHNLVMTVNLSYCNCLYNICLFIIPVEIKKNIKRIVLYLVKEQIKQHIVCNIQVLYHISGLSGLILVFLFHFDILLVFF